MQAIATLGGTFLDCNQLFCLMSRHDKDHLTRLSVFNLTAQDQLSYAFERLSELLTDPSAGVATNGEEAAINVRSSVPNLSLKITLLDPSSSPQYCQADCRKKRLMVTLVEAAPQATAAMPFSTLAFPLAAFAPVGSQEGQRQEDKPSSVEGPIPFYATG
jgi:hypothetical protein